MRYFFISCLLLVFICSTITADELQSLNNRLQIAIERLETSLKETASERNSLKENLQIVSDENEKQGNLLKEREKQLDEWEKRSVEEMRENEKLRNASESLEASTKELTDTYESEIRGLKIKLVVIGVVAMVTTAVLLIKAFPRATAHD